MNHRDRQSRLIFWLLLIGGIPPMISGVLSALSPGLYLQLVGDGVGNLYTAQSLGLLTLVTHLWGGDAFVAGAARVTAAFLGTPRLNRILGWTAILHSLYELWLLPSRFLSWCGTLQEASCSTLIQVETGLFLAVHVILIVGFVYALVFLKPAPDNAAQT